MPFTLAHPAAAVPLRRPLGNFASITALIIGSIAPDFVYFLPVPINPVLSHSLLGLFRFCLPMGIIAYYCFFLFIAPLVHELSPVSIQLRLSSNWHEAIIPKEPLLAISISIIAGAFTHIVWDSFTHANGVVVQSIPILMEPLFAWEGYTFIGYKFLQHGSTLLGLGLLCWWGFRWLSTSSPNLTNKTTPNCRRILLSILVFFPPTVFGFVSGFDYIDKNIGALRLFQLFLGYAIKTGGSFLLIWLISIGVIWRLLHRT